jgi:hypothetical protein
LGELNPRSFGNAIRQNGAFSFAELVFGVPEKRLAHMPGMTFAGMALFLLPNWCSAFLRKASLTCRE